MSTSDRTAYHHGDLRRALLDGALEILRREGVGAVSLREVARVAGVSHNAPYRHFSSREALLAGVAAEGFHRLRARLVAAGNELTALGAAYLAFAVVERPCFLLMFGSTLCKADFPDLAAAATDALMTLDRIAAGRATSTGGPVDPDVIGADTLRAWAIVHGFAHLVADGQLSLEAASRALAADGKGCPEPRDAVARERPAGT
ncbi:TetR/AcrR family transcriptional regulator [Methylobacterium sp. J-068]|uniref:TetR/AcrR family transcriptional regulator n=1 Tax=Methylobacterium sp. J-068 TaxID=2836649 RepID=UPI001FB9FFC6|nr:TetR/AcrR family transcriptional regulator [Methylobacterium sp. J-068]MCJ2035168.1 TetR/AcrR family transcriptional regulator [Methylobacterium sp. J-068]